MTYVKGARASRETDLSFIKWASRVVLAAGLKRNIIRLSPFFSMQLTDVSGNNSLIDARAHTHTYTTCQYARS